MSTRFMLNAPCSLDDNVFTRSGLLLSSNTIRAVSGKVLSTSMRPCRVMLACCCGIKGMSMPNISTKAAAEPPNCPFLPFHIPVAPSTPKVTIELHKARRKNPVATMGVLVPKAINSKAGRRLPMINAKRILRVGLMTGFG